MAGVFRRLRWVYKKLRLRRLRYALPFAILAAYTILGAYVFRHFELESDERRRASYRASTEYAFNQVLNRMMEVRCEDKLLRENQQLQTRHTKDALFWLIDFLNLTQVIEERSESSPWTWPGAMFYAGQLYTTIGYGLPVAQTAEGRLASILYIMFGIPIFLLILAQVGKLLSRALRKLYKRWRTAKLPEEMTRKMSEPVKAIYSLTPSSLLSNGGANTGSGSGGGTPRSPTALRSLAGRAAAGRSSDGKVGHANAISIVDEADSGAVTGSSNADDSSPVKRSPHSEDAEESTTDSGPESAHGKERQPGSGGGRPKQTANFPIPLALTILIFWIAFSAALFCLWETEWGYLTSVYFFFVSISTVGLGDIVPTKPDMMFINFMLILIGLALLSMCINLIQDALERLIEQLIEEYIDEIEKIAAVVTNNEEFAEEASTPFEVGMTAEMLTVPLTSIAQFGGEKARAGGGTWRSVKDWMAERIASNVLINRLDPRHSSDENDGESSDGDDDTSTDELEGVTVARAKVNVASGGSGAKMATVELPTISVHEGTPQLVAEAAAAKRKTVKKRRPTLRSNAAAFNNFSKSTMRAIQAIETAKMRTYRDGSFKSRLFSKFATNERLARLVDDHASLAAPTKPPASRLVTCSVQTSPPPAARKSMMRANCENVRNFTLESMDSTTFSSDLGPSANGGRGSGSCTRGDWASTSMFDAESLYSAGYFDVNFVGYSTDSVPRLLAGAADNTPPASAIGGRTGAVSAMRFTMTPPLRRCSGTAPHFLTPLRHKYSVNDVLMVPGVGSATSMLLPLPFPFFRGRRGGGGAISEPGSPPTLLRHGVVMPPGAPITTPPPKMIVAKKIALTNYCSDAATTNAADGDQGKADVVIPEVTATDHSATDDVCYPSDDRQQLQTKFPSCASTSATAGPTPTPTTSPTYAHRPRVRSVSGHRKHGCGRHAESAECVDVTPLFGAIPLYHRAMAARRRRRFSASDALASSTTVSPLAVAEAVLLNAAAAASLNFPPVAVGSTLSAQKRRKVVGVSSILPISPLPDLDSVRRVLDACGILPIDFLRASPFVLASPL